MKKIIILSTLFLLIGAGCSDTQEIKTDNYQVKDANQSINVSTNTMPKTRTIRDQKDFAAEYTQAKIKTSKGDIVVSFYADQSPSTVNNFMNLAEQGFYNGTKFHRIIKDFMIQGGDPNSKGEDTRMYGTGDPGYKFDDEFNDEKLVRGSLAMANSGSNTNGSQFFIVTAEATPWLDRKHTNFGQVVQGMNVVDMIENASTNQDDLPYDAITINSIELLK